MNKLFNSAAFSDPGLCRSLLEKLADELDREGNKQLRFMEVCGTHTVAIFRSGLRSLLPKEITHLSGPGCPVCVTHDREIAAAIELAGRQGVLVATFGDLLRVPGPGGMTLSGAKAEGADIALVYSPLDALALAGKHKDRTVVFLGVGFETTAPAVAATIQMAQRDKLDNFTVLSFHKLVPPALDALLREESEEQAGASHGSGIDAFLLPGHVSTILGIEPFQFMAERYGKPAVIGGFDPSDILQSLLLMLQMRNEKKPAIVNQYSRAVSDEGNPHARWIMDTVFESVDALWRGLGEIASSGLRLRDTYAAFDAFKRFSLELPDVPEVKGCRCGSVLKGRMSPDQCPLFGKSCTPAHPVGPCMVSTEGSCAAFFKYQVEAI